MLAKNIISRAGPLTKRALALNSPCTSIMVARSAGHDHPPADFKQPTMDDLPVPCGDWKEHYDNNQRKYNIHLLLGVGLLAISLGASVGSGAMDFYFTYPDKPASREEMASAGSS